MDTSSACPNLSRGSIALGWGRQPGRPKPARHVLPVADMASLQQHARRCCLGHGGRTGPRFVSKPTRQSIHPGNHSRGQLTRNARASPMEFTAGRNTALLAAQRTVASTGMQVAKHGNRKISSLAGASDTLEILGINTQMDPKIAQRSLEQFNFCFMLAPIYHPAMKNVMPVRQELGFRTVFNILGPLTNPATVKYQLIGVYEKSLAIKMIEVLRNLNTKRAWVVHGSDGTDEISITDETFVVELDEGNIKEFKISPKDAELKSCNFSDILGGSPKFNAQKIEQLVNGNKSGFFYSVIFNRAAALTISEKVKNLQDGVRLASEALLSGKTKELIENLKASKTSLL